MALPSPIIIERIGLFSQMRYETSSPPRRLGLSGRPLLRWSCRNWGEGDGEMKAWSRASLDNQIHLGSGTLLTLCGVLAVLIIACGTAQGSTSAGSTVLDGPAALLAQSFESSKDIKSFRATIEMDMTMLGQQTPLTLEMQKSRDGRVRMVMSMTAAGASMNIETIMSEEGFFTKMPGVGWVSLGSGALPGITGQSMPGLDDPMGFYNNLFPSEDIPWELYNVEFLGSEETDGVATEHLSIGMDFNQIWERLGKDTRSQFSEVFALGGLGSQPALAELELKRLEVWIDGEGYNRRTVMEMALGEDSTMAMDIRMSDFNQEITIDLPQKYQVFGLP
ncbi:MAG: hypothetical protein IIC96_10210 [Chloroflexi bacterium]|nr:hypothetical protein [Chloroflexota bacterium]